MNKDYTIQSADEIAVLNEFDVNDVFMIDDEVIGPDNRLWQHRYRVYLRTVASERQNHRCCYCGVRTTLKGNKSATASLDHYVPVCMGGEDSLDNSVMACSKCNRDRGSMPADEFYDLFVDYVDPQKRARERRRVSAFYDQMTQVVKTLFGEVVNEPGYCNAVNYELGLAA